MKKQTKFSKLQEKQIKKEMMKKVKGGANTVGDRE